MAFTNTKPNTGTGAGAGSARPPRRGGRPGGPGGKTYAERPKPEFDQKMISIRRVTRVVSGGRRMSFAVAIAIGDHKGSVGMGTGKGADTALAIAKALKAARKNMITVKLNKEGSIHHDVSAKYNSAQVMMMPNKSKGLVAGSAMRDILILAGIKNVTAKINSGSKNKMNNARATISALSQIAVKKVHAAPVVAQEEKVATQQ